MAVIISKNQATSVKNKRESSLKQAPHMVNVNIVGVAYTHPKTVNHLTRKNFGFVLFLCERLTYSHTK